MLKYQVVPKEMTTAMYRAASSSRTTDVAWESALALCRNDILDDLFSHLHDFKDACEIAMAYADGDDVSYWEHQLKTIAKIEAELAK